VVSLKWVTLIVNANKPTPAWAVATSLMIQDSSRLTKEGSTN
jgi:hypothetical protein